MKERTKKYLPAVVLATAMVFFAYDITADLITEPDNHVHMVIEFLVFVAISNVLFRELQHVASLNKAIVLEKTKTARLAGQLLTVMQQQFKCWELSSSEAEIALLLIKGLSMREIAALRNVKEKTVRHQATNIYAKSGYSGRHELAAHFIEDLMSQV